MDYVDRLTNCGISPDDAWFIVDEYLAEGDIVGLEVLVQAAEVEREWRNVD